MVFSLFRICAASSVRTRRIEPDDTDKQMPVDFQNGRPPMGHQAANWKKRGLRYVPVFGQLSVKAICLTTR
jgi:hypothetical protein